jgi:nucleotide-binding universal stress UspA family protein
MVLMFKKILVPIDGSPFSKAVLPHVRMLATTYKAAVHFLRVQSFAPYEPPLGMVLTTMPEPLQVQPADQLDMLAKGLEIEGIATTTEVVDGHIAEGILDCAYRQGADLIAMTTHGRSRLHRLWMGSVATKIVHASPVPVLLVRPEQT